MTRALLALVLMIALATTGCIAIGGKTQTQSDPPTLGKQLLDLKLAHDQGALTDEEYKDAKEQLIYFNRSLAQGH